MINSESVVGLITARGESKGLPGKNLMRLGGQSLVARTVTTALQSRYLDRLILSTDSSEIACEGEQAGCEVPFLRPAELATDTATSHSVALHALDIIGGAWGYLVLLQPTSPLRTVADIDGCIELACQNQADSVTTVAEHPPYWHYGMTGGNRLEPLLPHEFRPTRRQDALPSYALNGAVFVVRPSWLRRSRDFVGEGTLGYVMPRERSIDIDTAFDFNLCKYLIEIAAP